MKISTNEALYPREQVHFQKAKKELLGNIVALIMMLILFAVLFITGTVAIVVANKFEYSDYVNMAGFAQTIIAAVLFIFAFVPAYYKKINSFFILREDFKERIKLRTPAN